MGVGDAARDAKLINGAVNDLALITGQKPEIRKARKSIAQFKLREGMPIGARVTLRGDRMWEFLDRLVSIGLPAYPRLPRSVAQAVRRQRQLHLRTDRAVGVPRDRRGQHRPAPRHGHHRRHLGDDRRRRSRAAACAGLSVQGELSRWQRRLWSTRPTRSRSSRCAVTRAATGAVVPHAVYRKFGLCRICLREMAHAGELPGVQKSSW